jgi:hypothetical protein
MVAAEAATLIAMADGIASALPPKRGLADWERTIIEPPLQDTLYKYGANLDPAVMLVIACATIAYMRWQEAKHGTATPPEAGSKIAETLRGVG